MIFVKVDMHGGGDDRPANIRYKILRSKRCFCACAYFLNKNEVRATGKAVKERKVISHHIISYHIIPHHIIPHHIIS